MYDSTSIICRPYGDIKNAFQLALARFFFPHLLIPSGKHHRRPCWLFGVMLMKIFCAYAYLFTHMWDLLA